VLSQQECRELFKAPPQLKHRFLLAFAYAGGLRMNELRLLKISDLAHPRAADGRTKYSIHYQRVLNALKVCRKQALGEHLGFIGLLHT
jgi:integrase